MNQLFQLTLPKIEDQFLFDTIHGDSRVAEAQLYMIYQPLLNKAMVVLANFQAIHEIV